MSEKISTREELDAKLAHGCSVPGCDHTQHDGPMFIHAACHPYGKLAVSYQDGVMRVICDTCKTRVVSVRVEGKWRAVV